MYTYVNLFRVDQMDTRKNTNTLLVVFEENPQERGLKILAMIIARNILKKRGCLQNKVSPLTDSTLEHNEL